MSAETLTHLKSNSRFTPTPLQLAMDSFLLDAEARRLTAKTLHYYRQQLRAFLAFLSEQQITSPRAITAHHIRAYFVSMQRRNLADTSVHAAARAVRAFCNFLEREELVDVSPMRNVDHCHPHTFRRTFALWSLRAGMNIYALQQIMGHSDLSMLRRYLALVEEDLQDAHQRFGAVDSML